MSIAIMEDDYSRPELYDFHAIAARHSLHNGHVKAAQHRAVDLASARVNNFYRSWFMPDDHDAHVKVFQRLTVDLDFFDLSDKHKPKGTRLRTWNSSKPLIGPDFGDQLVHLDNAHVWKWWQHRMMRNWDFLNDVMKSEAIKRGLIDGKA
ncbi:MAG: hypothetical protein P4L77_11015 [Sulfuriferula sp.]|nr:hypothetical protein [Sulfuriferula sp.]